MADLATYELDEGIATITLDDGKRNALSPALLAQFEDAVDEASARNAAILLAGRAGTFSAGFDLNVIREGGAEAIALFARGAELMLRLFEYPRPVVAACTGHAIAGGALFLLVADRRLGAAGDFRIGLNEVAIGLPLPGLAIELARDRLAKTSFYEATLEARIYDPPAAAEAGWLDTVLPPHELVDAARADTLRLAALPAPAYQASKATARGAVTQAIHQLISGEAQDLTAALSG